MGINVFSAFDGMSGGQIALDRVGIIVVHSYASEIDKYAIKVTQANYPDTVQLGCITDIRTSQLPHIDLLIGGSPCQGFSFAGKQKAFDDPRSALFYEYVRLLGEIRQYNPSVKFMLENVRMKKEHLAVITLILGVEPICINSALVSAQNRVRYYWTNIEGIQQPEKVNIDPSLIINGSGYPASSHRYHSHDPGYRTVIIKNKFPCLASSYGRGWPNSDSQPGILMSKKHNGIRTTKINYKNFRKLTPIECERLQTVPDNYTNHVSNTQRYKMLGNGWTVNVVAHIFRSLSCQ